MFPGVTEANKIGEALPICTQGVGKEPNMTARFVIFDLDGTLADTSGDLIAAANHCFAGMGLDVRLDPARDQGIALRGGRRMLNEGLMRAHGTVDEAQVMAWYPKLLDFYSDQIDTHTVLYPGAMEAIAALKAGGDKVAICTNKPEALAERLMTRLGVRDAFGALIGADTLPTRKPDPAPVLDAIARIGGTPDRAVLVGDSDTDRNAARNAGIASVLVTFGPSGEDMAALQPEALLERYADLDAVLGKLLPK